MNEAYYDGDAAVAAMRRPALKVGGQVYTGKLISLQQAVAFQQQMQTAQTGSEDQIAVIRELCQAIDIPADALFQLPPGAALQALQFLFACLLGGTPEPPSSTEPQPPPRS
jgi:hypothetical protein